MNSLYIVLIAIIVIGILGAVIIVRLEGDKKSRSRDKHVIIPQSDIDSLENARKDLHDLLSGTCYSPLVFKITSVMYKITHRRYKEIK